MGCNCETAIANESELEDQAAVVIWAAHWPNSQCLPMHLDFQRSADGGAFVGWPDESLAGWPKDSRLLILGEPFGPIEALGALFILGAVFTELTRAPDP